MQVLALILYLVCLMTKDLNASIIHTFDLATVMPARFTCMFSMSWFGLSRTDPQGAGPDAYSSHWNIGNQGVCVSSTQPD